MVNTKFVIFKLKNYADLDNDDIGIIESYLKEKPQFKVYLGVIRNMIKSYNNASRIKRVALVSSLSKYFPSE